MLKYSHWLLFHFENNFGLSGWCKSVHFSSLEEHFAEQARNGEEEIPKLGHERSLLNLVLHAPRPCMESVRSVCNYDGCKFILLICLVNENLLDNLNCWH